MSNNFITTAADFEKEMKDLEANSPDLRTASTKAIDLMCNTLKSLGYEAGVKIFDDMIDKMRGN